MPAFPAANVVDSDPAEVVTSPVSAGKFAAGSAPVRAVVGMAVSKAPEPPKAFSELVWFKARVSFVAVRLFVVTTEAARAKAVALEYAAVPASEIFESVSVGMSEALSVVPEVSRPCGSKVTLVYWPAVPIASRFVTEFVSGD